MLAKNYHFKDIFLFYASARGQLGDSELIDDVVGVCDTKGVSQPCSHRCSGKHLKNLNDLLNLRALKIFTSV